MRLPPLPKLLMLTGLLATALAGPSTWAQQPSPPPTQQLLDWLRSQSANPTNPANPADKQGAAAAAAAAVAVDSAPILSTRKPEGLQALFAQGTVSGTDLVPEISALRKLSGQRSAADVKQLLGASAPSVDAAAPTGLAALFSGLTNAGLKIAIESLKSTIGDGAASTMGFNALDLHLDNLIGDSQSLANEKISLPSPNGMTPQVMQRTATMAALVIGARISARLLKQANTDFASAENEFGALIGQREAAAKLLMEVMGRGVDDSLVKLFAPDDLAYLRDNVSRMSLQAFSNDLGAQNLALRYLASTDATAYADYRARSGRMLASTRGYLRTVAGTAAFAGLLVAYSQQVVAATQGRPLGEVLTIMPLGLLFAKEAAAVIPDAFKAAGQGLDSFVRLPQRFRVVVGDKEEAVSKSADVFARIGQNGAEPLLQQALFRTGSPGLVYRMYQCDPVEAGKLMDAAMPVDERVRFAREAQLGDGTGFSFVNAFTGTPAEQRIGESLLQRDHRQRTSDLHLAQPQKVVAGDVAVNGGSFRQWNDDQLLRLIFVNREGNATHATLQLGEVRVRPIPSMQSIYAYESLVDGCAKVLAPPAPVTVAAPAAKPAATPAAAPKAAPAKKKPGAA